MKKFFKKSNSNLYQAAIVGILVIISLLFTFFFNLYFKTNIIFSHFFYLPICLSIIWWKKRGLIIVSILAISLLLFPLITSSMPWQAFLDNLIRALFLSLVGIVLTILSVKLTNSEDKLKERVKELDCLYKISNILCEPINTVDDILYGVLGRISCGFQYPEDIVAEIQFHGKQYKSQNYKKTEWKISQQSKVYDDTLNIEVFYLNEHDFLSEEIDLLNDIVQQIITIFEFKLEYL